jgi:hypothetical protein
MRRRLSSRSPLCGRADVSLERCVLLGSGAKKVRGDGMAKHLVQRILGAAALVLGCLFAGPAMAQAPANSPVAVHGQLSVRGNQIVDQTGAPVTLRGMSLFWSQWMPQYYNEDAIRWLRDDWNVTVVRAAIAVPAGGYMQHPERETAKAEAVIDAAIALGMRTSPSPRPRRASSRTSPSAMAMRLT